MKTTTSNDGSSRLHLTPAGIYWLVVTGAFAAIGIYKGINLILLLAYFLLVLFVLNLVLVLRTTSRVNVRFHPIDDGFVGDGRRCLCHVVLADRRHVRGLQVNYEVAQQVIRWYLPLLVRDCETTLMRTFLLPHRGIFANGRVTLKNSFPFGLVESARIFRDHRSFSVYPRRGAIDLTRLLRRSSYDVADRGIHRTAVRQLTEGTDIHGLRPFRPGDSPRWIHWRTTARVGELMVREFDRASGPNLTAYVMPAANQNEFEASLEFAGTLIWEWSRRQDGRLRLWIAPDQHWESWDVDHRRRAEDFLRRLARANFSAGQRPGLPEQSQLRGPIVYISSRRKTDTSSDWVDPSQPGEVYRPPSSMS